MSPTRVTSVAWTATGGTILDYPRFEHRGAMLDVARHFFTVPQVEHYIDELALYKVNYLHLHLSDDQGWRIAINSWPNLATYGGSTEVGGGAGGYYTQADYTAIVNYAASRYMTVVPEIDMPGHTNAALASYAQLNCNGVAPAALHGDRCRLQLAVRVPAADLHLHRPGGRRDRGPDPRPVLPHRRRRGELDPAGRLRELHQQGAADRRRPRQGGGRLAQHRRGHPRPVDGRAVLGHDDLGLGAVRRRRQRARRSSCPRPTAPTWT